MPNLAINFTLYGGLRAYLCTWNAAREQRHQEAREQQLLLEQRSRQANQQQGQQAAGLGPPAQQALSSSWGRAGQGDCSSSAGEASSSSGAAASTAGFSMSRLFAFGLGQHADKQQPEQQGAGSSTGASSSSLDTGQAQGTPSSSSLDQHHRYHHYQHSGNPSGPPGAAQPIRSSAAVGPSAPASSSSSTSSTSSTSSSPADASDSKDVWDAASAGRLTTYQSLLCGCASGFAASSLTFPLDLIRRRMQVGGWRQAAGSRSTWPQHLPVVRGRVRTTGGMVGGGARSC